ncbi:hypothetical protein EV702DRAFT_1118711 [Suillus placidus]|uniref:Uncharacterized protein n=1 Tax=Suillus placidus TaxID=48579 RepID=A0A9P7D184_9AGAM|nr:hypothetical protein EV702DRAFT_1118711 [Suillus placidus]
MRFSFVLAVVAALTVSISASEASTEKCPVLCLTDRDCKGGVVVRFFLHRLVCTYVKPRSGANHGGWDKDFGGGGGEVWVIKQCVIICDEAGG